jgi:spore maturation protein SpmA
MTQQKDVVTSKNSLKASLLVLHVILIALVVAVLRGSESQIVATMFDSTLTAIALNLGVISGNKLFEKWLDVKGKPNANPA